MLAILSVLLGIGILAMIGGAFHNTRRVKTVLAKSHVRSHLPKGITALVITVQFSELLRVIDHVSVTHLVAALLLLGVMLATKAGTEGELTHKQ